MYVGGIQERTVALGELVGLYSRMIQMIAMMVIKAAPPTAIPAICGTVSTTGASRERERERERASKNGMD